MIAFILRRMLWLVLTLWVVFTFTFFLMKLSPGSPLSSERAPPKEIAKIIEARYNLDDPLWRQYLTEMGNFLRFDPGHCYKMPDFTIAEIIRSGWPVSITLGLLALTMALALGVTAGIVSAVWRGSPFDFLLMSTATLGISIPNFVIAGLLVLLFVFQWPLFPAAGWGSPAQLVLPVFCLGAPYAADVARLTRTGMLDVLSQDYIRTAHAKGLSGWTVIVRHALKGAMLPVVSFLGPAAAGILTGSLVVEKIFAIPGLGMHFVESALQQDYTLAMALTLLYTLVLYSLNMLVDICYTFLDPRVKLD